MKFYERTEELAILKRNRENAITLGAKMTVVLGRRRIGKTSLILKSVENTPFVYLFVSKKNEGLLCADFIEEIQHSLGLTIFGEIKTFKQLFAFLMQHSQNNHFTLAIDEFQEFMNINASVYSDIQNSWDREKNKSKMNLIVSGSSYSIMKKIFENAKEPLFNRANERIILKPFKVTTLEIIFKEQAKNYKPIDLLAFYCITGGVPKYVELLVDNKIFSLSAITKELFRENSFWLDEGKNLLIEEFGKEYTTYFSILSLIASAKTSRSDIESVLQKNIGGYLERLINDYQIIKPLKPIFSKPGGRIQKYQFEDNFLTTWFRFVFKYRSAVEIGNYKYLSEIFTRDFKLFSDKLLEKWFIEKLKLTNNYSEIGNYWNKGDNEIDIVAINETTKKIMFAEVKLNKNKLNLTTLQNKATQVKEFTNYKEITYQLFSIEDMTKEF